MSSQERVSRITPFLWFDSDAGDAVAFYLGIFPNSRRVDELRIPGEGNGAKEKVLTIAFELDGQKFTALNGGAEVKFNESISFVVQCRSQDEVDYYWSRLTEGGTEVQCGWLKDKFGLSWQIVPERIAEYVRHPKAMAALMQMKKIDVAELERAAQS